MKKETLWTSLGRAAAQPAAPQLSWLESTTKKKKERFWPRAPEPHRELRSGLHGSPRGSTAAAQLRPQLGGRLH
jgi:hypothetical protein